MSASAKRDGMHLVAVIMGAPTLDERNALATKLLDFGFANYKLFKMDERYVSDVKVTASETERTPLYAEGFAVLVKKSDYSKIEEVLTIPEEISAPKSSGEPLGSIKYTIEGKTVLECKVFSKNSIDKIGYFRALWLFIVSLFKNV